MNMPILTQFGNSEQSMTSLEIAELVEKRHDNVKRTIQTLVERRVIALPHFEEKATAGRPIGFFTFKGEKGKRDSIIVVAQLCPELTARLVDRWAELEGKNRELSKMEILQMALESEQQKLVLQQQLEIQAPKVAFVDKYVAGNGNKTFRQVTKLLGANERKFRDFLKKEKIMYKLNGEWLAYQNHIDAKRFHNNTGISESNHTFTRSLFTPKGVEWTAGEWAKFNLRGAA